MSEHTNYYENLVHHREAKKALAKAKELEAEKLKKGQRFRKVDERTLETTGEGARQRNADALVDATGLWREKRPRPNIRDINAFSKPSRAVRLASIIRPKPRKGRPF